MDEQGTEDVTARMPWDMYDEELWQDGCLYRWNEEDGRFYNIFGAVYPGLAVLNYHLKEEADAGD